MAKILKATGADRGALIAMESNDPILFKSGRNIQKLSMKMVQDLNAYDVLRFRTLVFTPQAFKVLLADPIRAGHALEA